MDKWKYGDQIKNMAIKVGAIFIGIMVKEDGQEGWGVKAAEWRG